MSTFGAPHWKGEYFDKEDNARRFFNVEGQNKTVAISNLVTLLCGYVAQREEVFKKRYKLLWIEQS